MGCVTQGRTNRAHAFQQGPAAAAAAVAKVEMSRQDDGSPYSLRQAHQAYGPTGLALPGFLPDGCSHAKCEALPYLGTGPTVAVLSPVGRRLKVRRTRIGVVWIGGEWDCPLWE